MEKLYTQKTKKSIFYAVDKTKPDGTPRKWLDVTKLHNLGWKHKIELEKGLKTTYEWYKKNL